MGSEMCIRDRLEALKNKEMETPFAVIGRVLTKQEAYMKIRKAGVEK